MLITNNPILLRAAERNFADFEVPTSLIKAQKANMYYTNKEKADLDIRTSENEIGPIINLSQELNTLLWDKMNNGLNKDSPEIREIYKDIAQLDVMSGCEIDKAKKILPIDNSAELARLKEKYLRRDKDERKIRPNFFAPIAKSKGYYNNKKINYQRHDTAMDYLEHALNCFKLPKDKDPYIKLPEMFVNNISYTDAVYKQAHRIVRIIRDARAKIKNVWSDPVLQSDQKWIVTSDIKNECIQYVNGLLINPNTAMLLLSMSESADCKDISGFMTQVLFGVPNEVFYDVVRSSREDVGLVERDENGDLEFFGKKFKSPNNSQK